MILKELISKLVCDDKQKIDGNLLLEDSPKYHLPPQVKSAYAELFTTEGVHVIVSYLIGTQWIGQQFTHPLIFNS